MDGIKYNIATKLRPAWPYHSWRTLSYSSYQQGQTDHEAVNPEEKHIINGLQAFLSDKTYHEILKPKEGHFINGLQTLLHHLDKDLDITDSDTGQALIKEINGLIEATVIDLQQRYELFRHCRLLKTGSVVEGTKVCEMTEFDYLLILDLFKRSDIFHVYFTDVSEMQLLVQDCSDTESLQKQNPDMFAYYPSNMREKHPFFSNISKHVNENIENNCDEYYSSKEVGNFTVEAKATGRTYNQADKEISFDEKMSNRTVIIIKDIRKYCTDLFLDSFKTFLIKTNNFTFDETSGVCASDFAVTVHVWSEKYSIGVDIDICFCIPVTRQDIEKNVPCMNTNWFICQVMESNPELEVFAVVGCASPLLGAEVTTIRITAPDLELSYFQHFGMNSGQVKTYRYTKCIVNRFFPKATLYYGCQRCYLYFIKTYHLKNIIVYMMNNHMNSELWTDDNLASRVLEVFQILAKCIEEKSVSTYFLPGSVNISEFVTFTNLYVSIGRTGRRGSKVYIKDSEIWYKLAYCPAYMDSLVTKNEHIDVSVRKYFNYLNTDWNSFELIDKVRTLLRELFCMDAKWNENEEVLYCRLGCK